MVLAEQPDSQLQPMHWISVRRRCDGGQYQSSELGLCADGSADRRKNAMAELSCAVHCRDGLRASSDDPLTGL